MEEKNGSHEQENRFPLAGIRLFFQNCISTSRKKYLDKRILLQVDRKSVSASRNGEYVSTRRKTVFAEISEKSKKIVAKKSGKSSK